jgi:endoglucanase
MRTAFRYLAVLFVVVNCAGTPGDSRLINQQVPASTIFLPMLTSESTAVPSPCTTPTLTPETSITPTQEPSQTPSTPKPDKPPLLRGVARPSLEWWRPEWGLENINREDFENIRGWNANVVRVPINQRSWLEYPEYRDILDKIVDWNKELGMYTIIDLHWSEKGDPQLSIEEVGQQKMPDQRSLEMWKLVAQKYADDETILFELYNEPHDVSSEIWAYGGTVDEYEAVGMQKLVDAIRSEGAGNWIIVNGLDWGYTHKDLPRISDSRIIYGTHPYGNHNHKDEPTEWNEDFGFLTPDYPVIISEFGNSGESCDGSYDQSVIDYAEDNGISWISWAWYPGDCDFPSLIIDWSGTPTAAGEVVRRNLVRLNSQ